jgi:spore maturation protein CgeB
LLGQARRKRRETGVEFQRDEEVWEKNVAALRSREVGEDLWPPVPERFPNLKNVAFISGRPFPSLRVRGETGRLVCLHSAHDPWKEAEILANRLGGGESQTIVALGMGLGYHLLKLLPRLKPEDGLIIVEKEPEVFFAALGALNLTPLLENPNTRWVVEPDCHSVVHYVKRQVRPGNGQRLTVFAHPPSLRAHAWFYREVGRGLKPSFPRHVRALGVKKEQLRVLLVNPDYFLIPEVMRGFRKLGHEVRTVLFDRRREQGEEVVRRILTEVNDYGPDLVFTVNHLGLDRQGLLMEFFQRWRVPVVSWYVDSPAIILHLYEGRPSEFAYIFVWDPAFIPEVKALGFEKVFSLPLATDPEIFCPRPGASGRTSVAFVGNSLTGAVREKMRRLPGSPAFRRLFSKLTQAYREKPFRRLRELLVQSGWGKHPLILRLSQEELTDLEAGIIWSATREHRLACVRRLAPFRPVIYGDPGWRRLLKAPFIVRPEVNYFAELPLVYRGTVVNFNVTSLQMKTAVNQRVFDVPAAGGFLLTDFKAQLPELLEIGKEIICYHHPNEIPELTRHYLKSTRQREEVIARGRRRILAEHTYLHRLKTMVECIRRTI